MKRALIRLLTMVFLLNLVVGVALASTSHAAPPTENGCPTAYAYLQVDWLETQGPYMAPRRVDSGGNNNGAVCGLALPEAARRQLCGQACPVDILYLFRDDDLPSEQP